MIKHASRPLGQLWRSAAPLVLLGGLISCDGSAPPRLNTTGGDEVIIVAGSPGAGDASPAGEVPPARGR